MTQHEPTNGHAAKLTPADRKADRLEPLGRAEEREVLKSGSSG